MNIDPTTIERDVTDGTLRQNLEAELVIGFRLMRDDGDAIPLASYYAARIATIIHDELPAPLSPELAFDLYQEVLLACESARETVLGEPPVTPS